MNRFQTFIFFIALLSTLTMWGQGAPKGISYQSVVRDASGNPVANEPVSMLMVIRSGSASGTVVYTEKQTSATDQYGLVNLVVGQGSAIQGTFAGINWGTAAHYLSVSVETAPNIYDELGTTQLLSVPYALFAESTASSGGGGDNWGTQTVSTDPSITGNGTLGAPIGLASQNALPGQVLKWTGAAWVPQDDIASTSTGGGTITQINTNSGIVGGPITTIGTIGLSNTGVVAGTYGSETQVPVFEVDAQGRITQVSNVPVTGGGNTITVVGSSGIAVQQNGTEFTVSNTGDTDATNDIITTTNAGGDLSGVFANLQLQPAVVGNQELADASVTTNKLSDDAVTTVKLANTAVTTPKIANSAITAAKLDNMGASNGQVLKWNGTAWAPAVDQSGGSIALTGGTGITIGGTSPNFTITNSGDTNPSDDLTTASTAAGDVTGPFSNLQIAANAVGASEIVDGGVGTADLANGAVTGAKINSMSATNGQVLKWNGTTWAPANDQSGSVVITAGAGIAVFPSGSNYIISNDGDIDALDDITNLSQANGDLTGVFANLQIKPGAVGNGELSNNSVSTNNIINGAVTGAKIAQMSATIGQVLTWNGTAWAPGNGGSAGDNWGTQTAQTNPTLSGNGTALSPLGIAQQGATNGQVLTWNGTTWSPENVSGAGDNWGTQTAQTTVTLTGNGTAASPLGLASQGAANGQVLSWNGSSWVPASVAGDNWGSQSAQTDASLSGDGTSANPLGIAKQGASTGQVLTWNGSAWTPANAAGDNWGTQTAQTTVALTGNGTSASPLGLASQGAANGQVLSWNGSAWVPSNVSGDDWGNQVVEVGPEFTGSGTNGDKLLLAQQGASFGQTLKWDGNQWSPADDLQGTGGTTNFYAAGSGITITGTAPNFTINNNGDLSASNELQTLSLSGNELTLSNGGGTVTLPAGGGATYTAGTAISITGTSPDLVINNTGDISNTNELQQLSLAGNTLSLSNTGGSVVVDPSVTNELQVLSLSGNDLSLSNGGGTVQLPTGNTYTAGAAISITGTAPNLVINNTGDVSSTNELQTLSLNGNMITLSNGGGTISLPASNNYAAGAGIAISGTAPNLSISNTGDLSTTNELQDLQLNGTELKITGTNSKVQLDTLFAAAGAGLWKGIGTNAISNVTGNVGINTETPGARLTVKNGGETIRVEGGDPMISLAQSASGMNGFLQHRTGNLVLGTKDSSNIVLATSNKAVTVSGSSGNVVIGEGSIGAEKLKVVHNNRGFMLQNAAGSNWEFFVGDATGELELYSGQASLSGVPVGVFANNGVYTASDRRLKKEVAVIPSVLQQLNQLQPVQYRYNYQTSADPMSIGFIAQDVQALFPEMVTRASTRDAAGSALLVNYAGMSVLAIKAIQEQQQQLDQLKTENAQLKARLEAIEQYLKKN